MHMQPFRLLRFRNRIELESPPFPLRKPSQNGPRRQGFAPPRRNGAPLTAPGRSAKTFPHKRERRVGKSMALASKHRAVFQPHHARATSPPGTCTAAGGLDAETLRGFQLAGELFSLTSFFIEPEGGEFRSAIRLAVAVGTIIADHRR